MLNTELYLLKKLTILLLHYKPKGGEGRDIGSAKASE